MLRLVADTNTVVSALLWHGAPHRLFGAIQSEEFSFYASRALLDELADVLPRRKLARAVQASGKSASACIPGRSKFARKLKQKNVSAAEIVARYREIAQAVESAPIQEAALRAYRVPKDVIVTTPDREAPRRRGVKCHEDSRGSSKLPVVPRPHGETP